MSGTDASPLVQGITWAVSVGIAVIAAIIAGIRKGFKKEEKPAIPEGSKAEVMMGALIERTLVTDLTAAVRNLDGSVREVLEMLQEARAEAEIKAEVERRVQAELERRGIHHGPHG